MASSVILTHPAYAESLGGFIGTEGKEFDFVVHHQR
jgi:hypothetical protein